MIRGCLAFSGLLALLLGASDAQIMSVDLGHEFFKVALMRQGQPLEIILNTHSKRKTTTAVSFFEQIRTFGDDATAHQGKAPNKVPMFFHSTLGKNYSVKDIEAGGKWWSDFGLGNRFYSNSLGFDAERGVPTFKISEPNETQGEEVLASIFHFCKKMAEDSGEGKELNVRDLVVTVPADATLRQRQAIVAAGQAAGLRVLSLAHEGTAFAVQRAVDYSPEKGTEELGLFYNLGSRKAEVTIVRFGSRQAGMVAGKTAPVVTVLGSAYDYRIGGHLMDLKIAEVMLKRFQDKYPKLADGVVKNPRALRKLLTQAQKCKATLSANKQAGFTVESLFEDTDFQTSLKREEFEEMCADMFSVLTQPIEKALAAANVTLADIGQVQVVGGAWRVPKVQEILSAYIEAGKGSKIPLGQHLNGEEASALGAALMAANMSSSFRVKKIFLTDISHHSYAAQVVALSGAWEKNVTTLYPVGIPLGGKKKLSFSTEEDFAIRVFEDDVLIATYEVRGVEELLQGKWKEYNRTGAPKITATMPLEFSGIVDLKVPLATVEEVYWVNVTKPKPKPNATNGTENATQEEVADNSTDKAEQASTDDAEQASTGDAANTSSNASENVTEEVEVVLKQKKKKHEKKLAMTRIDTIPAPLSETLISEMKARLEGVAQFEKDLQAMAGIKNELEAAIYSSRDKLEREEIVKVTTEEQREELSKMATELEDWIYEPGATKSDFEQKLTALQGLVGPMEERAQEMESRASLDDTVQEAIDDFKKARKQIEKNMTWVHANKTEAVLKKQTEFEEWWKKKSEQQQTLPLHEAPAFTVSEVREKISKITKEWDKLKKTKKPKEPKAKKAGKNETSAKAKAEEKLPETVEAAEKELAAVREKKSAAVENEDFDLAHSLKQHEKLLAGHLEALKAKSEL